MFFFSSVTLVAGVWGLLGVHLADDPILPFNYLSYAAQLQVWLFFLSSIHLIKLHVFIILLILQNYTDSLCKLLEEDVSLHPLTSAIQELMDAATQVEYEIKVRLVASFKFV